MSIVEFLRARYAEEERLAAHSGGISWTVEAGEILHNVVISDASLAENPAWLSVRLVAEEMTKATACHIARHDPARILAEVEAKQQLLDQHVAYYGAGDDTDWPVRTLTLLALPYAAHPDYDERWRP